jgi:uncharacterized protein with HEPN domain
MTKEAQPYLLRIERALARIDKYRPATREEFFQEEPLQSEMLLQLLQIGENLSHIRQLDQDAFSQAPVSWQQLIGLRNIIAHGYETIKPELIWHYLVEELDAFHSTIQSALSGLPGDSLQRSLNSVVGTLFVDANA